MSDRKTAWQLAVVENSQPDNIDLMNDNDEIQALRELKKAVDIYIKHEPWHADYCDARAAFVKAVREVGE